jgi:hypothetical protein
MTLPTDGGRAGPPHAKLRVTFGSFTWQELERLCAPWTGPRLVPQETGAATLGVQAAIALMVRNAAALIRRSTPAEIVQACVPSVLWFSIVDFPQTCQVEGPPNAVKEFRRRWLDDLDFLGQVTGTTAASARRFLLFDEAPRPVLVSDLVPALDCSGTRSGYFVDLMTLGHQLAERAGRPLLIFSLPDKPLLENSESRGPPRR